MSIIFQLFSAEDLQKLSYQELQDLRQKILEALAPGQDKLEYLKLNLRPKTKIDEDSPLELQNDEREWVEKLLFNRFYEVFHQLKTLPDKQEPFDFEKLTGEPNDSEAQKRDKLILNWAISCELNHIEFYYALLKARKAAYDFFEQTMRAKTPNTPGKEGEEPPKIRKKDPDSLYSPFNPRHPLYRQYGHRSEPGTTG